MKSQASSATHDVIILGGGMAGLCLARQLLLKDPEISITLLEKRTHPAPEGAFKVGESTVEVAATYLRDTLQLGDHLNQDQLPKYGLRFFFNKHSEGEGRYLEDGLELGLSRRFPNSSYQIDRGRLENYLVDNLRAAGVAIQTECLIQEVVLHDDAPHQVFYQQKEERFELTARWVVDATGRKGLLKRQLGLAESIPHKISSAWFRVNHAFKIDEWGPWAVMGASDSANRSRWLSTVHLMGAGYWVWLIPLASGATSIGIVADPRIHPLSSYNSYPKALAWLSHNQPVLAEQLKAVHAEPMDFQAIKHFSYGCKKMFSSSRWALIGEAGLFLDPFYSPGGDYIAMGNDYACALIERDLKGKSIAAMVEVFDESFRQISQNTLRLYQDQYQLFGNAGVMSIKIIWDYSVYWAFPALTVIQGHLTDLPTYEAILPETMMIGELNARMQAMFRQWHKVWEPRPRNVYIDQYLIEQMYRFNLGLDDLMDPMEFKTRVRENLVILRQLAHEIVLRASTHCSELAAFAPAEDLPASDFLHNIWQALEQVVSETA